MLFPFSYLTQLGLYAIALVVNELILYLTPYLKCNRALLPRRRWRALNGKQGGPN